MLKDEGTPKGDLTQRRSQSHTHNTHTHTHTLTFSLRSQIHTFKYTYLHTHIQKLFSREQQIQQKNSLNPNFCTKFTFKAECNSHLHYLYSSTNTKITNIIYGAVYSFYLPPSPQLLFLHSCIHQTVETDCMTKQNIMNR